MTSKIQNTAILYFTRSADEEARAKSFCSSGNFAQNKAIAHQLITHTADRINETGFPVRVFNSASQQGHTFGEKLGNAFQAVFDEGFEHVIAIGNDCLQLTSQTIEHTGFLLQEQHLVAGPSADGGTYLLGISRKAYHKQSFISLDWESKNLFSDFVRYGHALGIDVTKLATLADIDDARSLQRFIQGTYKAAYFRLVIALVSILASTASGHFYIGNFASSDFTQFGFSHRGPPCS